MVGVETLFQSKKHRKNPKHSLHTYHLTEDFINDYELNTVTEVAICFL